MRRFLKGVRRGEKGFTLIELLIVVAILGILAAVVVPNLAGFIGAGSAAAANQEVANVETGAMAYYAEKGTWPGDSDALYTSPNDYLSAAPGYALYTFDSYGKVDQVTPTAKATSAGLSWEPTEHMWQR
jgi:prepilin-type N-terminal cleavage/methylation domain-containing protein